MDELRFAARSRQFAIATLHQAATAAGLDVIDAGGNAVDAALAVSATLAVVYLHMCGIRGDLFAIVVDSESRTVINGSGAALGGETTVFGHRPLPMGV